MWPNRQETADLVTFTEQVLNGELHFCAVNPYAISFLLKSKTSNSDLFINFLFCPATKSCYFDCQKN